MRDVARKAPSPSNTPRDGSDPVGGMTKRPDETIESETKARRADKNKSASKYAPAAE